MYTVFTTVKGVAPLLQHRFPMPEFASLSKGGHQHSGSIDYSKEWQDYFYATTDGQIYQPASHFEGALIKAATSFKIQGKRGKTYKDLFKSAVFINPDMIPYEGFFVPDELDADADKPLYLDVRPVVIQRSRVVRARPAFAPGWQLDFEIEVIDDQIPAELLQDVVAYAGKTVGVGDYRPRFGRFNVVKFEVHK